MYRTKSMKTRVIIILLGLLSIPSVSLAQKYSKKNIPGRDSHYFQVFAGMNKSANENLPWTEFTAYPLSTGAFVAVGGEITPIWGWRAALRVNHNKSRNVQSCESYETWGWNNTGLFADGTLDITDLLSGSDRNNTDFNLKAFAGPGLVYTFDFDKVPLSYSEPYLRSSRLLPAMRAGLTATWRLGRKGWHIGLELSHSFFDDHFNGVAHAFPLDSRTNLKLGVSYMQGKTYRPHTEIVRMNKLRTCPPLPFVLPDPEPVKTRQLHGRAFLDFPVNETAIYPDYRKNPEELARIKATVDSVMFDPSVSVTAISLHGYASPESSYSNNTRLASGRVESLKSYLADKYYFPAAVIKTEYTPEDWENLRGFLENTEGRRVKGDLWYDSDRYVETPAVPDCINKYHDDLIAVIDRDMDPDQKEELLKQVGGGEPYRWLYRYVYPGLRHTDYLIEYEVVAYQVKDGRRLIYSHPEALSLNEMFQVAKSYEEGSDSWFDAFIIAARQFPESTDANLNAACACVKMKRFSDARKYLKLADGSEKAMYVADVILAMEGRANWHMEGAKVVIDP